MFVSRENSKWYDEDDRIFYFDNLMQEVIPFYLFWIAILFIGLTCCVSCCFLLALGHKAQEDDRVREISPDENK